MTDDAEWLARVLGYRFRDANLLGRALTHRSAGERHNERLEFLGDAALGFVIAEALYARLPEAPEGHLTRLRASLVRRAALAEIALTIGLPERLRLGSGELKSGGFRRESILSNALEALLGAICLDGGVGAARELILALYESRLESLPSAEALKDPKTRLQEFLQARGLALPDYAVEQVEGQAHRQRFTVSCSVQGAPAPVTGTGTSRRAAEQAAARQMLERLEDD